MRGSLENRIAALEQDTPDGYTTFDSDRNSVIRSQLPALQWLTWAENLFRSEGRENEKRVLREQLARSVGRDSDGGLLYQLVSVLDVGPVK